MSEPEAAARGQYLNRVAQAVLGTVDSLCPQEQDKADILVSLSAFVVARGGGSRKALVDTIRKAFEEQQRSLRAQGKAPVRTPEDDAAQAEGELRAMEVASP